MFLSLTIGVRGLCIQIYVEDSCCVVSFLNCTFLFLKPPHEINRFICLLLNTTSNMSLFGGHISVFEVWVVILCIYTGIFLCKDLSTEIKNQY